MKKLKKLPLLARIIIAIALGIGLGLVLPLPIVRVFVTFNSIFSQFIQFLIPLIIIGLITPAISDIGKSAGKLLLLTTIIAYGDTVLSGYLSYFTSSNIFPLLINHGQAVEKIAEVKALEPFFTINIPALVDVMSALVTAFTVGLGIAFFGSNTLKAGFDEFKDIVEMDIGQRFHSHYRCDFCHAHLLACVAILHCWTRYASQSVQAIVEYVPSLFHSTWHLVERSNNSGDIEAYTQERRERRHRWLRGATVCYYSSFGQLSQDCCMFGSVDAHDWYAF